MKTRDAYGAFYCVPSRLPRSWHQIGHYPRAIGKELFALVDDCAIRRIAVGGDWMTDLCKQLEIDGPDRRAAKRALKVLEQAGLVSIFEDYVELNLSAKPSIKEQQPGLHSVSTRSPLGLHSAYKTTQVADIVEITSDRSDQIRVEERVRADARADAPAPAPARDVVQRPDLDGFRFVAALLERDVFSIAPLSSYSSEYSWIGYRPASEREAVLKAVNVDGWCLANKGHVDAPHLVRQWQKYLEGKPKPISRTVAAPEPTGFWAKVAP
jgi:hypothetical protein